MAAVQEQKFLTADDVAKMMNISKSTAYRVDLNLHRKGDKDNERTYIHID